MPLSGERGTAGHGVEQVENGAVEQTDGSREEEDEDGPLRHVPRVGDLPVQLHRSEGRRVQVLLQFLEMLADGVEEGPVEGELEPSHYLWCNLLFKSPL
jgi:hypothetical protein